MNFSADGNTTRYASGTEALAQRQSPSLLVFSLVVCSISLVGNVGVLVAICNGCFFTRKTNALLFSLSLGEIVYCAGALPYNYALFSDTVSAYACKGYFYVLTASRGIVSSALVFLARETVHDYVQPSRHTSVGCVTFISNLVWFFYAGYSVWALMFYTACGSEVASTANITRPATDASEFPHCCTVTRWSPPAVDFYMTANALVLYVIPVTVIMYIIIGHFKTVIVNKSCYKTKLLVSNFCLFILCHTPLEVSILFKGTVYQTTHEITQPVVDVRLFQVSEAMYSYRGLGYLIMFGFLKMPKCVSACKRQMFAGSLVQSRDIFFSEHITL